MTKDISYILKRVIIGVLIALLIMLIKGNLFTKVNAKTTITGGLAITYPTGSNVESYQDKYYTNIDYDSSLNYRDITALNFKYVYGNSNLITTSQEFGDINDSFNVPYSSMGASIYHMTIALGGSSGYNHLEFDKEYSVALKFTKENSLSWNGIYEDRQYYKVNIFDLDNNTLLPNDDFVKIKKVHFYTYQTDDSATNNGVFIITFYLDSQDYLFSSTNLALNTLEYDSYGFQEVSPIGSRFFSFVMNNTTPADSKIFTNPTLWFIQGDMLPYGMYCTDNNTHVGCGVVGNNPFEDTDGMDIIHDTDIEIMDELPTCDSLDIPCHINRVVKSIQDLFVRFGNFFREFINNLVSTFTDMFIPSSDYLTTYINDSISFLRQKLGFLEYPVELLVSLLNRFMNLTKQTSFSYSGFNYPGTNTQIIPSFTFDFDSITNDSSYISQLYSYYFIFMNGFLCLCFIRLCRKKLISIGLGG